MKFTVKFKGVPQETIDHAVDFAMFVLQEQVLTDTNFFVRYDQGTLKSSAQVERGDKSLVVSWNTPYARRVYYTGTPSTNKNPNASLMWAEKAHSVYGAEWKEIFEKAIGDKL